MVEEADKKDEEKFEFDSAGEALGYISLDQARVLAMEHVRDNRDFYGRRYAQRDLVSAELNAEESEDYYRVTLSYRPTRGFRGEPGVEQFTIDKSGPIRLRQILSEPQPRRRLGLPLALAGLAVVVAAALMGVLFVAGVFSSTAPPSLGLQPDAAATAAMVAVIPDEPAQLVAAQGDVLVDLAPGSVTTPAELRYLEVSSNQIPQLPSGYISTQKVFDLSLVPVEGQDEVPIPLLQPITVTVRLSTGDLSLAGGVGTNVVIQHYNEEGQEWGTLPTTVDFTASTAQAQVESLSIFALTKRQEPPTPTPEPTPTPPPTITPTPDPTATLVPTPTPTLVPTPTPVPSYRLTINNFPVEPGFNSVRVSFGDVFLRPQPQPDGTYQPGTIVTLTVTVPGLAVAWTAVDSSLGNQATVVMDSDRSVAVLVGTALPTATPVPAATAIPTQTPTPVPGATSTPTPTPTPIPTPIPTPVSTPIPLGPTVITKTADSADGVCDTDCSLREAIGAANSGDTVNIHAGTYTLSIGSELILNKDLTLTGTGPASTIIQAATQPGVADFRVFNITGGNVAISGVTIRHGKTNVGSGSISGAGGGGIRNDSGTLTLTNITISGNVSAGGSGIYNTGTVTLSNSTVSGNTASYGGAIMNDFGTLNITNGIVSGNTAGSFGGAIFNVATLNITNSIVSGNTVSFGYGGGIYNSSGTLTLTGSTVSGNSTTIDGGGIHTGSGGAASVTNSTVSANTADARGGGIWNDGNLTLANSTISGNSAATSGGGIRTLGTAELTNTIIANSPSGGDCLGIVTSLGHNRDSDGTCGLSGSGDIAAVDPLLGTLQDNGGPTFTHALLNGSPAIDAGDNAACPATDQRGTARPQGAICDIGAYEK